MVRREKYGRPTELAGTLLLFLSLLSEWSQSGRPPMADHPIADRHYDLDGLERWLEKYERFWVPIAALIVLALVGFAVFSNFNFYWSNPTFLLPSEW